MKPKLADLLAALVAALRRAGLAVGVAEAMDAARAAAVVGVERAALRDALAAALVKDERDRDVFLAAFAAVFPAAPAAVVRAKRGRRGGAVAAGGAAGDGGGEAGMGTRSSARPSPMETSPASRSGSDAEDRDGDRARGDAASEPDDVARRRAAPASRVAASDEPVPPEAERGGNARRRADERSLRALPFRAMTSVDVEACADLVQAIAARVRARVRRRLAPRPTGRLDFRRTIRAAVPHGGVPFDRRWRARRPGRANLVALVDLSASAATATGFFLAVLAPAAAFFRRVHLFGYVDRLVEIEHAAGQLRPAAPLDLMARSDFGRVLRDLVEEAPAVLGPDTVLLVLGDARNNRRPPRADLLAAARVRVRRVLWLNPEPHERWDTGDSVIASYARHVDAVVGCGTLAELERALAAVAAL